MITETYAIQTGSTFTAVTVDHRNAECRVALAAPRKTASACPNATSSRTLFVEGVSDRSIRRAACDGAARSYPTLRALMIDYPSATYRADLDC